MKYLILSFLLFAVAPVAIKAQQIDVNEWGAHIADSLQNLNIDTIEYYHEFCGECEVVSKPPSDPPHSHLCQIKGSWMEITNVIIYKQNGRLYSLAFDCNYPPIKKSLNKVESLDYFVSIIPILNKRDKVLRENQKKHLFPEPVIVDGDYQQATLYLHGKKKTVYLHEDYMKKVKPFWLDFELTLVRKIERDTSPKLPTAH